MHLAIISLHPHQLNKALSSVIEMLKASYNQTEILSLIKLERGKKRKYFF